MIVKQQSSPIQIVQIGAGAVGSAFYRSLKQDLSLYNTRLRVESLYLVDGDVVERKNFQNQLFVEGDEGMKKVHCLANRYDEHYGGMTMAYGEYITNLDELHALFNKRTDTFNILIGCVDNNRTRQLMHEYFEMVDNLLYIDVGVEGVILPNELEHLPHSEAYRHISTSGFSGQVVTGYKEGGITFLQPIAELYPTILSDEESVFPTQACAEIPNNPQRLATNKLAAQMANGVVNNLFHLGEIIQNEITFNARFGTCNSSFVSKEVERAYKEFKNNNADANTKIAG